MLKRELIHVHFKTGMENYHKIQSFATIIHFKTANLADCRGVYLFGDCFKQKVGAIIHTVQNAKWY